MIDIEKQAENIQKKARRVIEESGVIDAWKSIGAEVKLVGSLKTGLLMKKKDIDFHIYTPELNVSESFRAMAEFADNPAVRRIEFRNLIDTDERCIEWHAWYRSSDGMEWKIDMIHILKGSFYDGFFENVAERILAVLTPETKRAILTLKNDTPETENIMGIEYYQAVIRDGVRSWDEFSSWRGSHPADGVVEWCP
jgi:predicted nucleotidyltransferase